MEESRPDRTSDGIYEVMGVISDAYDKTSNPYVFFKEVVALSTMKRLTLDRYIRKAEDLGLVKKQVTGNVIYITDKGSDYLVEKKIIDE